ncbi:fibronectin type III domain-containing protein, partial [Spirosoma luteum]|uniref:fibronectin type III domain-containing protein n=1 Tax=Spirosoma luteum TaxID=431553 RepID=UPI0004784814
GIPGFNYIYVDGCNRYDPNSTARDANGDPYAPSFSNIMSYYNNWTDACPHDFTPGQNDRMLAGLALRQSHTSYTLNAPATNVTAVSNLVGSFNGTMIVLNWQDNANNEMGYFIERSTSATTEFVPIGGVAPNVTTFSDTKIANRTTYYYRIRPSNTTSGSLSPVISVAAEIPPVTGLTTTNISANSAQLNWNSLGTGAVYDVQWRAVDSASWSSINGLSTTSVTLYALTINKAYEWQVKASANDTYSNPVSFTTTCPISQYYSSNPGRTTTSLYWQGYTGQLFTLQWRPTGTTDWLTISNLTNSSYQLTGLAATTPYEWRLASSCPGSTTINNGYSSVQSFTTLSCQPPIPYTGLVFAESATLSWSYTAYEVGRTTELRYRQVGIASWTTISNLTGSGITLTGLLFNTSYEWQIRGVCSATDISAYSAPTINTFTTTCRVPTNLASTATATGAFLTWSANYQPELGSTYEVQYRLATSPDWITVGGVTGFSYTLAGLPVNSTYQWRIRTGCSGGNQSTYTDTNFFTTNCNEPFNPYASLVSSGSAQLNWSQVVDSETRNELQYRPAGTANWTTVSNIVPTVSTVNNMYVVTNYNLTGLINTTAYEWQVRKICSASQSSAFSPGSNFTTQCRVPPYISAYAQVTSATAYWDRMGVDVRYDLQYRMAGAADWSTFSNLTNPIQLIQNLTGNTPYEVRVRTGCSETIYSDYSAAYTFSTGSCTIPTSLITSDITINSAKLNWNFYSAGADTRYEGRYRVIGSADWMPLTSITSSGGTAYQVLTGLASDTQYEWQIKTVCSSTESSGFSSSNTFRTLVLCPDMRTVKDGTWSDPAVWSCGRTPTFSDLVTIKHMVQMPNYYQARAMGVTYDLGKQLLFDFYSVLLFGQ